MNTNMINNPDYEPKILRKRKPVRKLTQAPPKATNDEDFKVKTVSHSLAKQIQSARQAKKLTQKQLATQCNVKPIVIQQYEQGKGVPDQKVLSRMRRVLGAHLSNKKNKKKTKK